MLVKDMSTDVYPEEFLGSLLETCPECGADMVITESLSQLSCPNKSCIGKAAERLVALFQDLGVKTMGAAKCRKFLENFGTTNPYAIFMYEPEYDGPLFEGCSIEFSMQLFEQLNEHREMLPWEYLRIGNLPGIRDSARKLMSTYSSFEEFFDDLEDGGIPFVQEKLGIGVKTEAPAVEAPSDLSVEKLGYGNTRELAHQILTNPEEAMRRMRQMAEKEVSDGYVMPEEVETLSVTAVAMYENLMYFKDEILQGLPGVTLLQVSNIINICISTSVGAPFTSKSDFVHQMNTRYGEKVHLNWLKSVTKDCEFLIWSKVGGATNKVEKARKIISDAESKGVEPSIQILTGVEFEEYLKSL